MKTFNTIDAKDYTVEELFVSAQMSWELTSGSSGVVVIEPDDLEGAVTVQRASNTPVDFYESETPKINEDTGTYEYVMYRSVKHLFYATSSITNDYATGYLNAFFNSGSTLTTASLAGLPDESYVISIGQQFYGDRIKPGTFEISTELLNKKIVDDTDGNLYFENSGNNTYIGNVFYDKGIIVVKHNTSVNTTSVDANGLKLVEDSELYVNYKSDLRLYRHEVFVKLPPQDFNFSLFNPTVVRTYQASGASASLFTASMEQTGIKTSGNSDDTYNIYNLMINGIIKPYVTTIGLYNERYELLAVAKVSEPIQRTFNSDQIFIVRFDTD